MVNIARMAEDLGIDEGELTLILEVPEAVEAFRAKLAAADTWGAAMPLYNTARNGSLAEELAEAHLSAMLAKHFDNATTFKERCDAWSYAVPDSVFRRKTLEAILAPPLTPKQCDELLQWSDNNEEDLLITKKLLSLVTMKEEVEKIWDAHCDDFSASGPEILKKLATFY